jgi:hypothetical protein
MGCAFDDAIDSKDTEAAEATAGKAQKGNKADGTNKTEKSDKARTAAAAAAAATATAAASTNAVDTLRVADGAKNGPSSVRDGPGGSDAHQSTPPHNIPFILVGAGLLYFGWFGFNAGSGEGVLLHACAR